MSTWLEWARGPVFYFSLCFMLLGLLRHVGLALWEARRTLRRAGDKQLPWSQLLVTTLRWLMPIGKLRDQLLFSLTSILFHVAILIAPLFLAGHIALWYRGLGLSWPALPNAVADGLTVMACVTAVALVLQRIGAKATRALSRFQDYSLPLIIATPFASGFFVMHPALNPFAFEPTLLFHVLSGDLVMLLIPLTKLSHVALLPGVQVISELGWRWPSDAGSRVGIALGKEGESV